MTIFQTFFRFSRRAATWNRPKKAAMGKRLLKTSTAYSGKAERNRPPSSRLSAAWGMAEGL